MLKVDPKMQSNFDHDTYSIKKDAIVNLTSK